MNKCMAALETSADSVLISCYAISVGVGGNGRAEGPGERERGSSAACRPQNRAFMLKWGPMATCWALCLGPRTLKASLWIKVGF